MSKNLKVLGIGVLLIALAVGGWFLYTVSQSQNGAELTQNNIENQKQEQGKQESEGQVEELKTKNIDTSSWKEYCNQEYGFCVKYPENWRVEKMKFATMLPAPLPINCKKTPEKCPFDGVQFFSENSSVYTESTFFSVIVLKNDELKTKNGWYINKIEGNEFAPGDICHFVYTEELNDQEKILVSTSRSHKSECNEEQKDKLLDAVVESIKIIK